MDPRIGRRLLTNYRGFTRGSLPLERPRLSEATVNARNTPTIKNEFGTKNIGAVAYDAKWSAYGEYLQRLIDAMQGQWERLILRSAFYPTSGATVRVVFKLDAAGVLGARWMTASLRESPYDWFNFYPFWDTTRHAATP